ncbi:hypothetical protein [Acidisarcina polymorpha]|nr:hypothetical protein [Acidisarcina polymorpha]
MGLNDGLQSPMTDVFTHDSKPWAYRPIVPAVLRSTLLPLPPATPANTLAETARIRAFERPPHDAASWVQRLQGLDFSRSDRADTTRFNRILWAGLKGEDVPYPRSRSGRNLRAHRKQLLKRVSTPLP